MGSEVATCGHAVKEGLTYSMEGVTRDFEPCVDYGTWCAKCTLDYFENGERKILNSEVNKLCEEIVRLRALLKTNPVLH